MNIKIIRYQEAKVIKTHIIVFFFLQISFISIIQAATIKMGCFELKPHTYLDKEVAQGAAIAYFEKIAKEMGHTVKWHYLPFNRLIKYLKNGKLDGAQMITKNQERTTYLYYPKKSFFTTYSIFALIKEHRINKIESIKDIENFSVGFLQNANVSKFIKTNIDKLSMSYISTSNWIELNLNRVLHKRIDAAYDINHITLRYVAKKLGIFDKLKFINLPERPMHVYSVFSKASPNGKKYLKQYNTIFKNFTLKYEALIEKEISKLTK